MSRSIVVLHVDDERNFAELTATYLERTADDLDVITATDVETGLSRLAEGGIDCVVSDFEMPGRDGLDFLETVRDEYGDLPFVLFTGKGSEEVASDAIAMGATDYLQKRGGSEQYELLANRVRNAVEKYRSEKRRRRNERRFRAVFEDPEMLVALLDTDGTLLRANRTAMSFVDVDHEDVVGRPFWETPWWTDEMRAQVREWVERAADGEYIEYEDDRIQPDGRPRSAHGTIRPVTDENGSVESLIVSARDTTERMEARRRFEAIFENTHHFMGLMAPDGTILEANETALSAGGVTREEVVDRPIWAVPPFTTDDRARETLREAVETARDGDLFRDELHFPAEDGEVVVDLSVKPVFDDDGDVILLIPEGRDITERKQRERALERKNEQLEQFASVVSHDLRGPLGVLRGWLEMAQNSGDPDQFERCYRTIDRMETIIEDLLALARHGERDGELERVEVPEAAAEAWRALETPDATLRVETDLTILAEPGPLKQIFENLFRNSVEHGTSDESGTTGNDAPGDRSPGDAATDGSPPDEAVRITVGELPDGEGFYVEDDGPGIPPKRREDVLEFGYSTSEEGTGFGLAIVDQVAGAHGWAVTVTESAAGGARFEIADVRRPGFSTD